MCNNRRFMPGISASPMETSYIANSDTRILDIDTIVMCGFANGLLRMVKRNRKDLQKEVQK